MNITDQKIMITGGAGFFGSFLCEYLLEKGAQKIFLVDIHEEKLASISQNHPAIIPVVCDLTQPESVARIANELYSQDKISVLINAAGFIHSEPLINLFNKENPTHLASSWDKTIALNLSSCFNATSHLASLMAKNRVKGVIINISSIAAQGNIGQTAYSAAKAGIEAMTKVWAKELGMFKIRTVCIAPGFIETPSTHQSLSEAVIEKWKKQIPLGTLGPLEEIGKTVVFAIENNYLNGKIISVDGGLTI